ncbi:MAG: lactonase family protein [Monoglobaceae bacterium]
MNFDFYIAGCSKDGGVYHCGISGNGAEIKSVTEISEPMFLAKDGERMHILLRECFEGRIGGVCTAEILSDGSLGEPSAPVPTEGVVPCHLCVFGGRIYCVNYLSGSAARIPDRLVTHSGSGVNPKRQEGPHTHYINSFDGKYLLCTDLGCDEIYTYDSDLCEVSRVSLPAGSGPRHLINYKDKIFCANELGNTVSAFNYADGKLEYLYSKPLFDDDIESTAAAIRVYGSKLYVSNRGHDSISVFSMDGEELELIKCVGCGGKSPRDFNIINDILICTNEASDNVTFFGLNEGIPEKLDFELNIRQPLCVI